MMGTQQRWKDERLRNSQTWGAKIKAKANELQLAVGLPGELLNARSRLLVTCEHGTTESPVRTFCTKVCCCRIGSNERRTLSQTTLKKMSESQRKSWLRPDRFWADPENLDEDSRQLPDLFYVATKGKLTKVGRVKPSTAKKWFPRWDQILQIWELELKKSLSLEREVRAKFESKRPLDPSLGKGWTELFDVQPHEMILFIEQRLQDQPGLCRVDIA